MQSSQEKNAQKSELPKDQATQQLKQTQPAWQATFSKRLPHRIGEPLSSSGGGDGCSAP